MASQTSGAFHSIFNANYYNFIRLKKLLEKMEIPVSALWGQKERNYSVKLAYIRDDQKNPDNNDSWIVYPAKDEYKYSVRTKEDLARHFSLVSISKKDKLFIQDKPVE